MLKHGACFWRSHGIKTRRINSSSLKTAKPIRAIRRRDEIARDCPATAYDAVR